MTASGAARAAIAGGVAGATVAATVPLSAGGAEGAALGLAAGALLTLGLTHAPHPGGGAGRAEELERQLARCRRHEQPADVLVVRLDRSARSNAERLLGAFRLTDSVALFHDARELRAVLEHDGLVRHGLERRLAELCPHPHALGFGWAAFPADGVTLDALVARARARLPRVAAQRAPGGTPLPVAGASGP